MSYQLGQNSILGISVHSSNVWGTETAATILLPGWGGAHGSGTEMGYTAAAGEAFQQTDHSGVVKATAEFKGALSFQGYEAILGACFGKASGGAPSGSAANGYTTVFDFASTGQNSVVCTVAQYEGLTSSVRRCAETAKVTSWTMDIPKSGPVMIDAKFLASRILPNSAINTEAILQALSAFDETVYRQKIHAYHFGNKNNNNGYVRLGPSGDKTYVSTSPIISSAGITAAWISAITVLNGLTGVAAHVVPEKVTCTATSATQYTVKGSISGTVSGTGTFGSSFTGTFGDNAVTFTVNKSGTASASDTVSFYLIPAYAGAASNEISLSASDNIYPNHQKIAVDWHLEGAHGPDRYILEPFGKQQPMGKLELDFDDDEGSSVDPNNVLRKLKALMFARQEGEFLTDYGYEAYAESSVYAGTTPSATCNKYSMKIQCPRLSPVWKDSPINAPGPQAGKFEFHMLKPFAARDDMAGVTCIMRITLTNKLSTAWDA